MAAMDQGVANLQNFITHLVASTRAVEQAGDRFRQEGARLAELDGVVTEDGGGLNRELEDFASAFGTGREDAEEALTGLAEAAAERQSAIGEAQAELAEAGANVDDQAATVLAELGSARAQLTAEGFEALGQALEETLQELDAEARETVKAFADLEGAAASGETSVAAAWDAAEAELDQGIASLQEGESGLESAAAENVQGLQAAAGEFEEQCSRLESEVDVIYDALDGSVEDQGREWEMDAQRMAAEAVSLVQAGAQQRLGQAAALAEDKLTALSEEWSALGGTLDGAAATAGELQPLAEELAKCQTVAGHIDELLNALAE